MRDHYVYTAYDANNVCLYVGCTSQPDARYRAHMRGADARGWFGPYANRWHVSGPYTKEVAYHREKQRIADLDPIFNGTSPSNKGTDRMAVRAYTSLHGDSYNDVPPLRLDIIESVVRRVREQVVAA